MDLAAYDGRDLRCEPVLSRVRCVDVLRLSVVVERVIVVEFLSLLFVCHVTDLLQALRKLCSPLCCFLLLFVLRINDLWQSLVLLVLVLLLELHWILHLVAIGRIASLALDDPSLSIFALHGVVTGRRRDGHLIFDICRLVHDGLLLLWIDFCLLISH